MKGVVLAAGKGKRLRPLTYTVPKPLLPVANKPMIRYGIDQLINVGIREIGIVIHPDDKELFEEKLDYDRENVRIQYIFQQEQKGISHAVREAEKFIGTDSFVLLLGDNVICESLKVLKKAFHKEGVHGSVLVTEVRQPKDYGIAEIKNDKIIKVEEKPAHPRSNLAVLGAYIFHSNIFKAIHSISPSPRGEYEITDAIQWMIDHHYPINYVKTEKPSFDVGTVERWLEANRWMLQESVEKNEINGIYNNSIILPPVKIGKGCTIDNAVIGPHASIESNVTIQNCMIKNSIVLQGACLKNVPYEITESIIGEEAKVIGTHCKEKNIQGIFSNHTTLTFSNSEKNRKNI